MPVGQALKPYLHMGERIWKCWLVPASCLGPSLVSLNPSSPPFFEQQAQPSLYDRKWVVTHCSSHLTSQFFTTVPFYDSWGESYVNCSDLVLSDATHSLWFGRWDASDGFPRAPVDLTIGVAKDSLYSGLLGFGSRTPPKAQALEACCPVPPCPWWALGKCRTRELGPHHGETRW